VTELVFESGGTRKKTDIRELYAQVCWGDRGPSLPLKKLNLGPAEMQFQITINSTVAFSSEFVTFCAIFGRIGRLSSEEVILQLIKSKCVPMLIYGLGVCHLRNSDLKALDFVVDRFFMKLFQTCNMEIIRLAQQMFNLLPSELIEKRANKFLPGSCML